MTSKCSTRSLTEIRTGRSIVTLRDGHGTVRYRYFSRVEPAPYRLLAVGRTVSLNAGSAMSAFDANHFEDATRSWGPAGPTDAIALVT